MKANMKPAPAIQASKDHLGSSPHKATHDLVDHKVFPKEREHSAFAQHMVYHQQGLKTHTSRHDVGGGAVFYHVSAWRPKGQKAAAPKTANTRSASDAITRITGAPMKKSELLDMLLKAQKEGRLKVRNLIAKLEAMPVKELEEALAKAVAVVPGHGSLNTSIHTPDEVKIKFSSGMLADKHRKVVAEAEKLGRKVMVHHYDTPFGRVVHGMEIHDEAVKKSQGDTKAELKAEGDPIAEYQKGANNHMDSAKHMGGHKLVDHTSHDMMDHHDRRDFMEHVMDAAEKGHKVHVTYHPGSEMYHVSSWKPIKKK